jgi:Domain of unknown function (DUF4352)
MRLLSPALVAAFVSLLPLAASAEVTVGGMSYSVVSVSRASTVGEGFLAKQAAGEFIIVRLSVKNVGKEGASISNGDFHLKRGDTEYDADNGVMIDGEFFLEKLNPGTRKTGVIVFDVPANTAPSKYTIEVFGNGSSDSREIRL